MTHFEITHCVDDEGLRRVRLPRNDLVEEKALGDDRFSLVDGPFDHYERAHNGQRDRPRVKIGHLLRLFLQQDRSEANGRVEALHHQHNELFRNESRE